MSLPAHLIDPVRALLCDADGILFPSEEPAFVASARVTNDFLAGIGSDQRWGADELRRVALGRNFRALAQDLLEEHDVTMSPDDLDTWVHREQVVVTEQLATTLRPDSGVREPLERLSARWPLALVSSSALSRLDACLAATQLSDLFSTEVRVSAQDSLPRPTSKPDPAVYLAALARLGLRPEEALAVEDAASGVRSAVAAGIAVIGNLVFIPEAERAVQREALLVAGASDVVTDWTAFEALVETRRRATA